MNGDGHFYFQHDYGIINLTFLKQLLRTKPSLEILGKVEQPHDALNFFEWFLSKVAKS